MYLLCTYVCVCVCVCVWFADSLLTRMAPVSAWRTIQDEWDSSRTAGAGRSRARLCGPALSLCYLTMTGSLLAGFSLGRLARPGASLVYLFDIDEAD